MAIERDEARCAVDQRQPANRAKRLNCSTDGEIAVGDELVELRGAERCQARQETLDTASLGCESRCCQVPVGPRVHGD